MPPETIALYLKEHQMQLTDWPFAGLARELHRWAELLDCEFTLSMPAVPVLQFDYVRRNAIATYRWSRNQVGTKDNITFNIRWLHLAPAETIAVLLHELLHLWQHSHGRPGKRNYHNVEFRNKARECGLVVTPQGCNVGMTETFTTVLDKHGVQADPFLLTHARLRLAAKQPTKMRKYRCWCTTVRCATELQADCRRCEHPFLRED